ncbi:DUF4192 domain-containing protein [Nonomuraea sp. NPDC050540]|uniref:DUF4192 domain-containing protein n=1 Tax=Nonomuraea sp. NPDC050540 TaxID=3364367 RepID=UPI003795AE06
MTPCLTLLSPSDILAAVPYLVGFHPSESLIVIGMAADQAQIAARWSLPLPEDALAPLTPVLEREKITELILVGYGAGPLVTPAIDEARRLAAAEGVKIGEALRAEDGRYWSYTCDLPHCCPPTGTPYDPTTSPVAAEATVHGMVALPDRQTLERTIAPCTGPVRMSMRAATATAVADLRTRLANSEDTEAFARKFVAEGLVRVRAAIASHAAGRRLDDTEAAKLGLDLTIIRIRDEAWTLMDDAHTPLWKDLTRRLEPRFVPAAASLLAMSSWRSGDSVLAVIALERALTTDPAYSMANLLMHALQHLMPPSLLRGRLPTPAELDTAMGTPRAAWLLPLTTLLDDPADAITV